MLHHQGLPFVPQAIWIKLIIHYHDNLLAAHFGIEKTCEFLTQKYYWSTLRHNIEAYMKGCDICLASKAVRHKLYSDLQSLPIPTFQWKDLLMDFVTGPAISTDWKEDSYDFILVIIDRLIKTVQYTLVKVTINTPGLAEVIINVVVCHHSLPDLIVTDRGSFFTLKFWSSLCYFFEIKWRLFTIFHPQIDGQTERQNRTIEAYLQAFVNFK